MPMVIGNTTIFVSPTYDVHLLANGIQDERVTGSSLYIHHLNDILSLPNLADYDFSSLQACIAAGSIVPHSLCQRATKIAKHLLLAYGGTEGFLAMQSYEDHNSGYVPEPGSEVNN
ncbi:medium-chain acyl-CoA ligase ACSF2, mitochondrial-like [Amphiura filiformis]|uniref:medium-chain acyl-CoA ligase ACSF2, mitochondrial-like n=1 Tax=Amphiura filiformis TaxID=82378 RepID=UPI003B20CFC6